MLPNRKNNANLRIKLHGFLRHWLDARVPADLFDGVEPTNTVSFGMVVDSGTVAHGLLSVAQMGKPLRFREQPRRPEATN